MNKTELLARAQRYSESDKFSLYLAQKVYCDGDARERLRTAQTWGPRMFWIALSCGVFTTALLTICFASAGYASLEDWLILNFIASCALGAAVYFSISHLEARMDEAATRLLCVEDSSLKVALAKLLEEKDVDAMAWHAYAKSERGGLRVFDIRIMEAMSYQNAIEQSEKRYSESQALREHGTGPANHNQKLHPAL